jgi:multidrug efflux pump subunit AcrA (membrane-fusion protein)
VASLVRGESLLVRVTVPLSTLAGIPTELYAGRFGAQRTEATLTMKPVWAAPSDVNMPGPSLFALVPSQTTVEGEHVQVWVPNGPAIAGVLIPAAGVVLNGGRFWCYVERTPGTFERVAVRTDRPFSGGYVVTDGVKAGDPVVVSAVAHLLAKESGSADESD